MLHVHHSNRVERLAGELTRLLARPSGPPLAAETVVVGGAGVQRWLQLRLADALGVCANVRFPLPAEFIWQVFRATLPEVPATARFVPAVTRWRLLDLLRTPAAAPEFAPLRGYLHGADERRHYELAGQIAEIFDQYLVFRPDWVRAWECGGGSHWQAHLWRRLVGGEWSPHWVYLHDAFLSIVEGGGIDAANLPPRVALFALPALSPAYMDIVEALATCIDVHLFVLNPCRQYWGDIVSERVRWQAAGAGDAAARYLDVGNSLLASLGRPGRDFIDRVTAITCHQHEHYEEPGHASLLQRVQADVLDLRDRAGDGSEPEVIAGDDRSIQVHNCHSPMREVEVLHDQLLALFERHLDLQPAEVLVLTPDIDAYASYITAVFGTAAGDRHIPYSVSDRSALLASGIAETFLSLLEVPAGRCTAAEVLAPLEIPAVQRRFGLDDDEVGRIHRWVRETGVRWGLDATARAEARVPADQENTWAAGLDRLLLGYAMPAGGERLFAGVLAYDEVEGGAAQTLGRLIAYLDALRLTRGELGRSQPVAAWTRQFSGVLARFFDATEAEEPELQAVRECVAETAEEVRAAGFRAPVGIDVVRIHLRGLLGRGRGGAGLRSGGVCFCGMAPMRSLPFEVVCLLGMNADAYPRLQRQPDFDLMAQDRRRGDRRRRDEDRYQFLETLLSARRCLHVSYVGQDLRDNTALPPSVLVSELLDYLDRFFKPAAGGRASDDMVTRHPLQSFSRRYFSGDAKLFTYAAHVRPAPAVSQRIIHRDPFSTALPEPDAQWREVDLEQFIRFFMNPARYLLRERLGVNLGETDRELAGDEPFALDRREEGALRDRLVRYRLAAMPEQDMRKVERARGVLPHAGAGELVLQRGLATTARFAEAVALLLASSALEPVAVDLALGPIRLTGVLAGLRSAGLAGFRTGRLSAHVQLDVWIRHLLLNCLQPAGVAPATRWLGVEETMSFGLVAQARELLAELAGLYLSGLCRPLRFFPRSSHACAVAEMRDAAGPLAAARKTWQSDRHHDGEDSDPYYQLAFAAVDPLDAEFEALAMRVWRPLLACVEIEPT